MKNMNAQGVPNEHFSDCTLLVCSSICVFLPNIIHAVFPESFMIARILDPSPTLIPG